MKKNMVRVAVLCAMGALSQSASAATGTVTFNGSVVPDICNVDTASSALTVSLGKVGTAGLTNGKGSKGNMTAFDIAVTCNADTDVAIAFSGVPHDQDDSLLSVGSGPDVAVGVGVGVFDSEQSLVNINRVPTTFTPYKNGIQTKVRYYGAYQSATDTVTPGTGNAVASFSLMYK